MWQNNFISSIVLLAIAVAIFFEIRKLPIGSLRTPKIGFFPFILATLLTIFSLLLLWQTIKGKGGAIKEKGGGAMGMRSPSWRNIGLTLGVLFAYAFLLEPIGFIISTFFLISFLLRVIGAQKWWVVILVGLSSSLLSFLIFGQLLDARLPAGILGG